MVVLSLVALSLLILIGGAFAIAVVASRADFGEPCRRTDKPDQNA